MIEKVSFVRNPLTVIAMFASLAEISGTVVLPLLAEKIQSIYVWFLMLFPSGLVVLFFSTLYFRHKALYAPSDYKDESMFNDPFKSAPSTIIFAKQEAEKAQIDSFESEEATKLPSPEETTSTENAPVSSRIADSSHPNVTDYFIAEDQSIQIFENLYNLNFRRNVILDTDESYIFDAVAIDENRCVVVDIRRYIPWYRRTLPHIEEIKYAQSSIIKSKIGKNRELEYILCLIVPEKDDHTIESIAKYSEDFAKWLFLTKVYVFSLNNKTLKQIY